MSPSTFVWPRRVRKNIGRFQVAMDDANSVGGVQSVSNLDGDVKNLSAGQWLTCDEVLESLTFQELHHDEGMASASSISWMVQMLGWLRAEEARASR